jgi:hypothetical protein
MLTLAALVTTCLLIEVPQVSKKTPDFSGSWTFDAQKTAQPDEKGRVVLAAMLGDEFTALQTATSLTLRILTGCGGLRPDRQTDRERFPGKHRRDVARQREGRPPRHLIHEHQRREGEAGDH